MTAVGYAGKVLCRRYMPLAREQCARWAEHRDGCRTRAGMDDTARNRRKVAA